MFCRAIFFVGCRTFVAWIPNPICLYRNEKFSVCWHFDKSWSLVLEVSSEKRKSGLFLRLFFFVLFEVRFLVLPLKSEFGEMSGTTVEYKSSDMPEIPFCNRFSCFSSPPLPSRFPTCYARFGLAHQSPLTITSHHNFSAGEAHCNFVFFPKTRIPPPFFCGTLDSEKSLGLWDLDRKVI